LHLSIKPNTSNTYINRGAPYIYLSVAYTSQSRNVLEGVEMDIKTKIEDAIASLKAKRMSAQGGMFGLPAWAQALVGVLVAVLFISLFYGIVVWTGAILANTILYTPGGNVAIGSSGQTAYQAFVNLFQYVFTVGSFAGIAIILAVVSVVFIVFYYLLGGGAPGAGGR
jgi:hypothetical protein